MFEFPSLPMYLLHSQKHLCALHIFYFLFTSFLAFLFFCFVFRSVQSLDLPKSITSVRSVVNFRVSSFVFRISNRKLAFKKMSSNPPKVKQNVCLIVIDGWGITSEKDGNAILNAKTPVMDRLCKDNSTAIEAHGEHVGLPEGKMGNSEVGHLNIGAGRVVIQDIVRINLAMEEGTINQNEALVKAFENAKSKNGRVHFLGLVSDGGVHSHIDHLLGLLKAAKQHKVPNAFVHFFADGRDTSPKSGVGFVEQLLKFLGEEKYGKLSTVMGRYYAMDRDKRWDRMKIAYEGLVAGTGEETTEDKVLEVVRRRYKESTDDEQSTDEFLKPIIVNKEGLIKDDDTLVFINFRPDRMRQIVETMGVVKHFETEVKHPKDLNISCMTRYNKDFPFPLLFEEETMKNVLAEWISSQGVSQFHCAETEKYAHVTFFFNGRREAAFDLEDRALEPSPKEKATYNLMPEMNCKGVAEKMAETIKKKKYPFVMCNFAPPDMVGHTGFYDAAVKACEATDEAIGIVEKACKENDYLLMVTADHGNAEKMKNEKGEPHTAHTCYPVPFTSSGKRRFKKKPTKSKEDRPSALCDVAPTVLDAMGLSIPEDMTGESLLEDEEKEAGVFPCRTS